MVTHCAGDIIVTLDSVSASESDHFIQCDGSSEESDSDISDVQK